MKKNIQTDTARDWLATKPQFRDYSVEKVETGVATDVFRLFEASKPTLYLRISPWGVDTVSSEIFVYELLKHNQILAPEVIYSELNCLNFEGLSCIITSEIKGVPVESIKDKEIHDEVLKSAGKDLAKLNSIEVGGFGFLTKNGEMLSSDLTRYSKYFNAVITEKVPVALRPNPELGDLLVKLKKHIDSIDLSLIDQEKPVLIHGDMSEAHIYAFEQKYSGLIDFGNNRGSTKYGDLGYIYCMNFNMFSNILAGYQQVMKLHPMYMQLVEIEATKVVIDKLFWRNNNSLPIPEKIKRAILRICENDR